MVFEKSSASRMTSEYSSETSTGSALMSMSEKVWIPRCRKQTAIVFHFERSSKSATGFGSGCL